MNIEKIHVLAIRACKIRNTKSSNSIKAGHRNLFCEHNLMRFSSTDCKSPQKNLSFGALSVRKSDN